LSQLQSSSRLFCCFDLSDTTQQVKAFRLETFVDDVSFAHSNSPMSLPNQAATDIRVLASILNKIGASEYLQGFIDDGRDDANLKNLSRLKPERISSTLSGSSGCIYRRVSQCNRCGATCFVII
jgi:hypothetical protein